MPAEDFLGIKEYKVLGTRPIRHDGVDKVTGRAIYGADVSMSGLIYGKVLRSPHAHARIVSIHTGRAESLDGVKAVATVADIPIPEKKVEDLGEGAANMVDLRANVLADGKVVYDGHAVAAVAATSSHIAEKALGLIDVEYEVLEPLLDVRAAMKPDSPLLHDALTTESLGEDTGTASNIATHFQHKLGDTRQAFARADVVIEKEFFTDTVHQGYIEPQNATALWNPDGRITVWCSTQGSFTVREQLAGLLQVSPVNIRVIPTEIGGGFGGKIRVYLEPVAAILSRKSGHPVKMVMNRDEVLRATGPTPGSYIRAKMGATNEGKLVAAEAYLAYESGGFAGTWAEPGAMCIFAPYDIENVTIDGYNVVVNKPQTMAYRAPGATNAAFASETIVDEICERLGEDPLEFRLKNSAKEGTRRADGPTFPRVGHQEVLRAAMASDHYNAPLQGKNRGRGVASGFWFNVGLKSSACASVNTDGTVSLVEGSTDIGGTRTSVAMQLAEPLGIPAEDVNPVVADTDGVGETDVTGGSRVTFATGWAAYNAAQDIIAQMVDRAAKYWEISPDDVAFEDGTFKSMSDPSKSLTFKELSGKLNETGGPVVGRATVDPQGVGGAFSLMIADVETDPDTGKVDVLRVTMVQDAGKAVHPAYVEGQMQGGAAQGIGWGLNEEYWYSKDGELTNASLLDYRMPTCLDLPMIETIIVEVPNPGHPYGVRGVGEAPIVPPPAALANAIYRAAGVRMNVLPMSPGNLLKALWNKNGS